MIGVIAKPSQTQIVEEFFELFKTPWEPYRPEGTYDAVIASADDLPDVQAKLLLVCGSAEKEIDAQVGISAGTWWQSGIVSNQELALPIYGGLLAFKDSGHGIACVRAGLEVTGIKVSRSDSTLIRLGYDLFAEIELLLSKGQPAEHAHIPTLDIHIRMLREWIVKSGIPLLEIPPIPAGRSFLVCLTHDIDFVGIRAHRFDHSMWGFVYRATVGAILKFVRGRLSFRHLLRNWLATASLPFVYVGWAKDFWEPFEWYLGVEEGLPVTYFLIPFKRRAGEKVPAPHAARRATAYDVSDLPDTASVLLKHGCEIGVHGIDAWHSVEKGRQEISRIAAVTGRSDIGIRMHWLLRNETTPAVLEQAGYAYDSTFGYNEAVGYRAGTSQVFRPLGSRTLLEVPLHIQDGALFYPQRLGLSEPEAEKQCHTLIDNAGKFGGVLTLLWHDRSHGPERFWGGFYVKLLNTLKSKDAWFGTASEVAGWFRKRRNVRFELLEELNAPPRIRIRYEGEEIQLPLTIRLYQPPKCREHDESGSERAVEFVDISWDGKSACALEHPAGSSPSVPLPDLAFSLSE